MDGQCIVCYKFACSEAPRHIIQWEKRFGQRPSGVHNRTHAQCWPRRRLSAVHPGKLGVHLGTLTATSRPSCALTCLAVTLQPCTGSAAGPCTHLQCWDAGSPPCPAGSEPRAAGRRARRAPPGGPLQGLEPRQAPARPPARRSARRRRPAARRGAARPRPAPRAAPCWPPPRCRRAPAAHSGSSLPHGNDLGGELLGLTNNHTCTYLITM